MKKHSSYTWLSAGFSILMVSPLLAQVENVPASMPRLEPVIQSTIVWGLAVLFPLLVLIISFKAPKRNYYNPKK